MSNEIEYSDKYNDDDFEYRHVTLPQQLKSQIPTDRLMTEREWRNIGVQQSRGWRQYAIHKPEPHVLLFRRPLGTDSRTGKAPPNWKAPQGTSKEEIKYWKNGYQG